MAVFNPQIQPSYDPNWTNITHPISDVTPDKSTAIAIETGAKALDSGVKVADTLTKQSIQKDTTEGVDNLRDAYTESLQAYRNIQIGASAANGANPPDSTLLPDQGATPPPANLQSGLNRVQQLGTAIAQNSGKTNDTLYTGALNSLAKQLRSSYPGYRDYIDEQIKSVSGVDPANAFMKNLMEDINRNQESTKTEDNATMAALREKAATGFHDINGTSAADVMEMRRRGIIDNNQSMKWLNGAMSLKYDLDQKAAARKDRQDSDSDTAITANKDLSQNTGKIMAQAWNTMTIGKGTDSIAKQIEFFQKHSGDSGVSDEEAQVRGRQLQGMRNNIFNAAWAQAQKDGTLDRMGGDAEKAKATITARLAPLDNAIKDVFNKDWGAAYGHMQLNEAISNDSTNLLYNLPDDEARVFNRMSGAFSKISPQAASSLMQMAFKGKVPQAEVQLLQNETLKVLTQPYAQNGRLSSAQAALDELRRRGATSAKTFDEFVKTVNMLSDPTVAQENKINLANAFFDPEQNKELLSDKNFQKDTVINGRQVPGKYSVFNTLSTDATAKSIKELSKTRPEIAKSYNTMMTQQFGEQLYSRELQDLRNLNEDFRPTANHPGFQVKVTNDGKGPVRMEMVTGKGEPVNYAQASAYGAGNAYLAINRLNGGMAGLFNVYSATGPDAGQRTMETLYRYGYREANPISDAVTSEMRHDAMERLRKKDGSRAE